MSLAVILQFAGLAVVLVIGALLVYVIFEMRTVYADQRDSFLRAIASVEDLHRIQPEFVSFARRLESDGGALREVALDLQRAVAELDGTLRTVIMSSAGRHSDAIRDFREHIDMRDVRLTQVLESLAEKLSSPPPPIPASTVAIQQPETTASTGEFVRLRRDLLKDDPQLRFAVLKDWMSVNILAVLRRVSRDWRTPKDLIAGIPDYLEPEAEVLDSGILLVGTRGHLEKLATPIREMDPSGEPVRWFEPSLPDAAMGGHTPAILTRSNGSFEILQKGTFAELKSRATFVQH